MPGFFQTYERIAVPWLLDRVARGIGFAVSEMFNALQDRVEQGILARMPGEGTPTALPYLGADRSIERGPTEGDESYAGRLRRALPTWKRAGSAPALLEQLRAFFLPSPPPIRVVSNGSTWHSIDPSTEVVTKTIASPANWTWDAFTAVPRWWRGWVIIDSSAGPWTRWQVGDPGIIIGDEGLTIGSTATAEEIAGVKKVVRKWKPANVHAMHVIVTFDASIFEVADAPGLPMPDGTFANPLNRTRPAAYWQVEI